MIIIEPHALSNEYFDIAFDINTYEYMLLQMTYSILLLIST